MSGAPGRAADGEAPNGSPSGRRLRWCLVAHLLVVLSLCALALFAGGGPGGLLMPPDVPAGRPPPTSAGVAGPPAAAVRSVRPACGRAGIVDLLPMIAPDLPPPWAADVVPRDTCPGDGSMRPSRLARHHAANRWHALWSLAAALAAMGCMPSRPSLRPWSGPAGWPAPSPLQPRVAAACTAGCRPRPFSPTPLPRRPLP